MRPPHRAKIVWLVRWTAAVLTALVALIATPAMGQSVSVSLAGRDTAEQASSFGVAGAWRVGSVVPIQLEFRPDADFGVGVNMDLWVQWEVPNADGDIAEYWRRTNITRGGSSVRWLYAPVSPLADRETIWSVRIFEVDDNGDRGAEVGGARIRPPGGSLPMDTSDYAIAFVRGAGTAAGANLGLQNYIPPRPGASVDVVAAHGQTRVIKCTPEDLPDRWIGLKMFDVMVWASEDLTTLDTNRREAIRQWVDGGGHLVIVLPTTGVNPWELGQGGGGPLIELMPSREPELVEIVDHELYIRAISKARVVSDATETLTGPVLVFDDVTDSVPSLDPGWEPLITMGDGRVIAVRRQVGHGHLSLVGLSARDTRLNAVRLSNGLVSDMPQADSFWNEILGRRVDAPTAGEARVLAEQRLIGSPATRVLFSDGRVVTGAIPMDEEAGAGLLLAMLLFAAYWLLAGPLGFAVLKANGMVRHAWVAFVLAAAVFTGLAWGGVTLLRKRDLDLRHLTVLDWVADTGVDPLATPQYAHIRSWISLYLPSYGSAEVALPPVEARTERRWIESWISPEPDASPPFPNPDRYAVDIARPGSPVQMPARSTVTRLHTDYLGPIDSTWADGVLRVDPDDPVRVVVGPDGQEELAGSLINMLPGALRNLTVVWVRSDRPIPVRYAIGEDGDDVAPVLTDTGRMRRNGDMWDLRGEIDPRARFSIALPPGLSRTDTRLEIAIERFMEGHYERSTSGMLGADPTGASGGRDRLLKHLSLREQLTPPRWRLSVDRQRDTTVALNTRFGRELDLSPWFARPCLIVMGFLSNDTPLPYELSVDGRPVSGRGTTMVRWIYPLPTIEELAFDGVVTPRVEPATDGNDGSEAVQGSGD